MNLAKHSTNIIFLTILLTFGCITPMVQAATRASVVGAKSVSYTSALLSQFWKKPIVFRAKIYIPTRCQSSGVNCPVLYHFPGYGSSPASAQSVIDDFGRLSARFPKLAMVHVYIDADFLGGYNYFTDSANYGPWNSAFAQEFTLYISKKFSIVNDPKHTYLLGGSSGAWSALWLQVSNADHFGGVWSISPDPVDFHHFYQANVAPGSSDNWYYTSRHTLRPFTRSGRPTIRDEMLKHDNNPRQGGEISSYEFAWSEKGSNGLPERLFDRNSGALNQEVLQQWKHFDIAQNVSNGGEPLKVALAGKLHILCGSVDDYFYDQGVRALCGQLSSEHYNAQCEILPGRDHGNVIDASAKYPNGLRYSILQAVIRLAA